MNVRLIVPRRADRGERDRLWRFCSAYWRRERPGWEIVEGEHTDGPFNRSAAINTAAEGDWDVAVIVDADTVVDAEPVERGVALAARSGDLILPFDTRCLLSRQGTRRVLAGLSGPWDRWVAARQTPADSYEYVSGCQIVPRSLWDAVGGFDPRFEGWGGEDDAFTAACQALTGVDPRRARLSGSAWHLWHRPSPYANHRRATYRMAKALSDRYLAAAGSEDAMRELLAEDRGTDQTLLVVPTTGTRTTLEQTLASADRRLSGPIGRRLICVDGPVDIRAPKGWEVCRTGPGKGYAAAVAGAIECALGSGQPWIFWLEDDFTFNQPVDVGRLQALMDADSRLLQVALKRQAWYEHELAAGGVIEANPGAFTQHEGYVTHRAFWTMNPMLCRRSALAAQPWPQRPSSELLFGRVAFRNGARGAYLGQLDDPPLVTHIGAEQAGDGY